MAGFQSVTATLRRTESELWKQLQAIRSAIAALTGGGRRPGKRGPGRPNGSGRKRSTPAITFASTGSRGPVGAGTESRQNRSAMIPVDCVSPGGETVE